MLDQRGVMPIFTIVRSVWHTMAVEVSLQLIGVYFLTAAAQSFPGTAMSIFLYDNLGLTNYPERVYRYYGALFLPNFAKAGNLTLRTCAQPAM